MINNLIKQLSCQKYLSIHFEKTITFFHINVLLSNLIYQKIKHKNLFILDDLFNRVKILNMVIKYFEAIICFLDFELLPEPIGVDLTSLNQYANKRLVDTY